MSITEYERPDFRALRHIQPRWFWVALVPLAWLVATQPLSWLLVVFGASVALVLSLLHPWLAWIALAFFVPITSALKQGPVSITDLVLAYAVGLWFLDGTRRDSVRVALLPPLVPAILYVIVLLGATLNASDLGEATAEVVKWAEFAVLLAVAPAVFDRQHSRWLAAALVGGATMQAMLGLYQFVFQIGPDWFLILGRFMRASGTFRQPNPFGGYLGLTLPVAVSLAIAVGSSLLRRPSWVGGLWFGFFAGTSVVVGAGLVASWSRGAWLGALAGLVVVASLWSRTALVAASLAGVGIALGSGMGRTLVSWAPLPLLKRLGDLSVYLRPTEVLALPVTDENFAVVERVAHWVAAIRMWERAPWIGIGPGNYATVYESVRLPRWDQALGHAHNVYLNVLAESGIVGLAAFLGLWFVAGFWVWQAARRASPGSEDGGTPDPVEMQWGRGLAIGVLGVMAHLAIHNLFDNLFVQGMILHVGLWLVAVESWQRDGHWSRAAARKVT